MAEDNNKPENFRENWPFYWISQINASYTNALEVKLRPIGVDIPRWRAMMCLYESEYLSISDIAKFSAQRLNTTTKVIQRMTSDGLVSTRISPKDGRVTEVCLTPMGEELRSKAFEEAQVIFENVFAGIGKRRIEELNRTLARLHDKLEGLQ